MAALARADVAGGDVDLPHETLRVEVDEGEEEALVLAGGSRGGQRCGHDIPPQGHPYGLLDRGRALRFLLCEGLELCL